MASRKDELNAYTFAKRRTLAAFVQPSPTGTEEDAPRPLRAVVPGMGAGALLLAAFGAWGLFRPAVPDGWDEAGANVIVASESTTRYVVLKTGRQPQLHPVLNLASARLLLNEGDFDIVTVDENVLDSGEIAHGPTLGIPYAPDRLPSAAEAASPKRWAVCQQPGGGGDSAQQAVFVLADREAATVAGPHRLTGGEVLYVRSETSDTSYLVDRVGTKYRIAGGQDAELLHRVLADHDSPQLVTEAWLDTLDDGTPIDFPVLPDTIGAPAGVPGLGPEANRVGMVLRATTGTGPQHYVVLPGKVVPVSDFTARLLRFSPAAGSLGQVTGPLEVGAQTFTPAPAEESVDAGRDWPEEEAHQVNGRPVGEDGDVRDTVCSVLRGVDPEDGTTELATWAGTDFPVRLVARPTSAYVTPGAGLLFRQVQGEQAEVGGVFLVTDTGLRYAVPSNGATDGANEAQLRLGYGDVTPVPVPADWSTFLPTGPRLDPESAKLPQGA